MAISPTTNSSTTNSVATQIGAAVQQVQNNQQVSEQDFLQMLTTQLSNQDPTQPVDENQMLAQLAQFSTVEGVNNLLNSQTQQQAISLLGHTVQALVSTNNSPQMVSGKVVGVSWNGSKVSLTLDNNTSVTLDEITQVS
ncbi:flagellar hook assembly protein FlgD [Chthonomonas calidirosea]|uniref:Flagellar hook capping protein n=1 Tax=Chthonomonas calidirosea (strain DSM 23976 / ICMP 18418 / T49) TaxID=1303518 RepID=S0EVT5_CHTCT|nr:flagellar hook capping FlgD N-terminal domain-containing protein [Chthonomonas calidirosea]CCW35901.1 Flagellar hook capping protein [Chthonomonas calidirosea T49]CEK17880.1 flagellar hook capping protein [Chthonomonas calidirosea]CEK18910.1 flagellar hook capping protein [Chthonomonas calidirosea]